MTYSKLSGNSHWIVASLYLVWKLADLLISIIAPIFVPYLGHFSYADKMFAYNLPGYIRSLSNFDGVFYIRISQFGYQQYEQAFFPVYPLLIRLLTPVTAYNPIIAGVLIANFAFILSLITLKKLLGFLKFDYWLWFFIFLFAYPTSFFFGVMYTESLFLLFFVSSIYFFIRKNYLLAFIFAYLTGLTRVVGVLMTLFFGVYLMADLLGGKGQIKKKTAILAVTLAPILGLLTYCSYLWQAFGDPLYFFTAQEHFGAGRTSGLVLLPQVLFRYLKIFSTASWGFPYFVAAVEFSFFGFAFLILLYDLLKILKQKHELYLFRFGLNLFSFANLLLPTLTGNLSSIPRYSMLSLSIFFVLAEIKTKSIKLLMLGIFIALHIVLLSLFIQGYYIT